MAEYAFVNRDTNTVFSTFQSAGNFVAWPDAGGLDPKGKPISSMTTPAATPISPNGKLIRLPVKRDKVDHDPLTERVTYGAETVTPGVVVTYPASTADLPVAAIRERMKAKVKALRLEADAADVEAGADVMQAASDRDHINIIGAALAALVGAVAAGDDLSAFASVLDTGIEWRMKSNAEATLSRTEMLAQAVALLAKRKAAVERHNALDAAIDGSTKAQLKTLSASGDLETGWPESPAS